MGAVTLLERLWPDVHDVPGFAGMAVAVLAPVAVWCALLGWRAAAWARRPFLDALHPTTQEDHTA